MLCESLQLLIQRLSLSYNIGTENIIKALRAQYTATLNLCVVAPDQNGTSMEVDKDGSEFLAPLERELRDQLCELADFTLQAHSEQLHYLEGLPASTESNIRIASAVTAYDDTKTALLGPLGTIKSR